MKPEQQRVSTPREPHSLRCPGESRLTAVTAFSEDRHECWLSGKLGQRSPAQAQRGLSMVKGA